MSKISEKEWPALKKALWRVLMDENLNDGHYIKAFDLVERLYEAAAHARAEAVGVLNTEALEAAIDAVREKNMFTLDGAIAQGIREHLQRTSALAHPAVPEGMVPAGCADVGLAVRKVKGYPFPGEIRSVFKTRAGVVRYVVEATGEAYAGMLHIFSPDQIAAAEKEGE